MTIVLLAVALLASNLAATRHVLRDGRRLGYEKAAEIGLIWVLPVFGVLVSVCISLQSPSRVRAYENVNEFFRRSS